MKTEFKKYIEKGFTLIELLIVVVILGILAAVVIPQLSGATDGAELESLKTNLARMRTAIDLYKADHSKYPAINTSVASGCGGTDGLGLATSGEAFTEQLTMYTDIDGKACSKKDTTYKYGPYLKATEVGGLKGIPKNPITGSAVINMVNDGNLTMIGNSTPAGWKYDRAIGKIIADDATGSPVYATY